MNKVFLIYGIHQPEPIKYAWLGLTYLSIALKIVLILQLLRRQGYQFPGLILYMATCCVSGALQNTRLWGVWGELLLTIGALLFVLEAIQGTSGTVRHETEVYYIRLSVFSMGLMMIGVSMIAGPAPWGGYSKLLYYWRVYTIVPCFSALFYSLAFHFSRETKIVRPFLANTVIGSLWFAIPLAVTRLNTGKAYTNETYPWFWSMAAIGGQIVCLLAWMIAMRVPSRREAVSVRRSFRRGSLLDRD